MTVQDLELPCASMESDDPASELVQRLQRGEPSAVGEAYDEHQGAVRAFARRLLGDPSLAEDMVHEVFVTLPKAVQRFRGDSSLRTFLISIAVNHARHFARSRARYASALERLADEPGASIEDPERHTQRRELADILSRALSTLPLDQRVVFVLCDVEQRASTEAAGIVGVPDATVRTRLFHARKKLRAALEQEGVR
jgi:RNA polymerase sigma-70 factor, ECF subfamily